MFKKIRSGCLAAALLGCCAVAHTQTVPGVSTGTWTPLVNQPPFGGALVPILMTDGSVLVQDGNNYNTGIYTNHWWKLTPDANGSYISGTWTRLADMDVSYAPLFYASAVLPDGKVIVEGGEYNYGSPVWTTKGAIYDPTTNVWTNVAPPAGWSLIGDAQCVVLPNGQFMLAQILDGRTAVLDESTLTWTANATTGKVDRNDEEGWTLLPDGTVLTVDCTTGVPGAEKWDQGTNQWYPAGTTPAAMTSEALGEEMGAAILRFDGKVIAFGANSKVAIYTPPVNPLDPGSWAAATDMPSGNGQADGPACLLPNGKVLIAISPSADNDIFNAPCNFFETDGVTYDPVANTAQSAGEPSFLVNFLVLPNGQVMETDTSNHIEIYTPVGGPQDAWRPTISTYPSNVSASTDYPITGTQFNGLSQTNSYGDDWANATNYPLVRITNNSTGHVFYCRTHGHSTMAVATGATVVSTNFTTPAGIENGPSKLVVVANGIPSASKDITVGPANQDPTADAGDDQTVECTGASGTDVTLDGSGSSDPDNDTLTYSWSEGGTEIATGVSPTVSLTDGVHTITLTVDDGNGGTDTDDVQITVQDTKKPVFGSLSDVTVTATSNAGAVATFGPFYANDDCDGSILGTAVPASGSTFAPGSTLVTVSATDDASNTGTATFHVKVLYSWSGFLSPLPKQQVKMGSNIPIKFALTGASAGITNLVATGYWNNGGSNHLIGTFTYGAGQYQLQFKTNGVPKGNINIVVTFGDGTVHTTSVIIK